MAKLFISYRRVTWAFTHRLAERLEQLLEAQVFVDFKGIDESNFESAILRNLRESDAFLLIVAENTFAHDKIHDERDWVRREIREALTREPEMPIALALYEGIAPPPEDQLPEDIRDITKRQGIPFYPHYFDAGANNLARFLNTIAPALRLRTALPEGISEAARRSAVSPHAPQSERFAAGLKLLNSGYYQDALKIFQDLEQEGYSPGLQKSLRELINDASRELETERRRWQFQQEYDLIAALLKISPHDAWARWLTLKKAYHDLFKDPAELDKELATWRYSYIAQLLQSAPEQAEREWTEFKQQYPKHQDVAGIEQRLAAWRVEQAYKRIVQLLQSDPEGAEREWTELKHKYPNYQDKAGVEQRLTARRAKQAYRRIAELVQSNPEQAEREWTEFRQKYPQHEDTDGVEGRLAAWRYASIVKLVHSDPKRALREWADFSRCYPSYGDPSNIVPQLMPRLVAWSPRSYARLLIWMLWSPQNLKQYQSLYGQEIAAAYGLSSLLAWMPLFLLHLAAVLGTVPTQWRYAPAALLIVPICALLTAFIIPRLDIPARKEVAFVVAFVVALVVVAGVTSGMAIDMAFGVVVGVAFGVASVVAFGAAFGAGFGAGFGAAFGVAFAVVSGMAFAVAVGVAFAVAGAVANAVEEGKPNLISRAALIALPLSYAAMIWLFFL